MIDSPTQNVEDIHYLAEKGVRTQLTNKIRAHSAEQIHRLGGDLVRCCSIVCYFLRMSWQNRLQFLRNLSDRIRSLRTISIILNTMHSLSGKLTSYCVATPFATPITFDKIVNDHNRMLDEDTLKQCIAADLRWFEGLDDRDQVAYFINLFRNSGGPVMRILYYHLLTLYNHRVRELPVKKSLSRPEVFSDEKLFKFEHDPEDPKHQKVLELEKNWDKSVEKFVKDMEKMKSDVSLTKTKSKSWQNKKKKSKKDSKKAEKKKKKMKTDEEPLDWIQLMPIGIVKKIFDFLDLKTLKKAKQVNEYWKWAIDELLKDRKVQKMLIKTNKKLKAALAGAGNSSTLPPSSFSKQPTPRVSQTEKRMKKLRERGAILEELRFKTLKADDTSAVLLDALRSIEAGPFVDNILMFPKIRRTRCPYRREPAYIVKDLNLIYENTEELSISQEDGNKPVQFSMSMTSDPSDYN